MATSSLYQIEKLDEKNYETWSVQMRSVLIHSGFWKYVSGDEPILPVWSPEKIIEWENNDEKALASIMLSVKSTQLNYIKNIKRSKDAWNKLKEVYKPTGPMQKVSLFKKLLSLNMKNSKDMVEYLNTFGDISEKLADIGIQIPEELLVIILLSSLPKEYENFVVVMETRDVLPALATLKIKLLEEHERKNEQTQSNVEQAFFSEKGNKSNKGKDSKKVMKGNCFKCGKKGHYANKCNLKSDNIKSDNSKSYSLIAMAKSDKVSTPISWYIDSGATSHMCANRNLFTKLDKCSENILLANKTSIVAEGIGTVNIFVNNCTIELKDVLYSSDLNGNFLSVSKVVQYGGIIKFNEKEAIFTDGNGELVLKAERNDNLFTFDVKNPNEKLCAVSSNANIWHRRYGHLNYQSLSDLSKNNMVNGMNVQEKVESPCQTCMVSKIHSIKFPKQTESKSGELLNIIHSDVCGPMNTTSIGGSKYFLTFIDDKSRKTFVYFLKHKSEVFEKFKAFKEMVERQTNMKIKCLRSDNGGEYVSNEFSQYLENCGIQRQLTVPYTPQQNGVAERANRTIVEMARCMLVDSKQSQNLWAEAVATAVYLRNRSPSKSLDGRTPYEIWTGRKPNVKHLKVFGCNAVVLNRKKGKFDPKGSSMIMVGYSRVSKAYRLYDRKNRQVVERRNVLFDELNYPGGEPNNENQDFINFEEFFNIKESEVVSQNPQNIIVEQEIDSSDEEEFLEAQEDISEMETSEILVTNEIVKRGPGRPKIVRSGRPGRPRKIPQILNNAVEEKVPNNYKEALCSKDNKKWKEAMLKEISSLEQKGTWSLEELPHGQKAIKNKWVYALKKDSEGKIERYKARLVAKGCSQQYGLNYKETFSPVVRYETIRMILALAVEHKMHLHQLDVVTAYLNGNLQDVIYMQQPEGFVDKQHPNQVLRLHKSLYGLKQSGREWNFKLNEVLTQLGFKSCQNEPCLYQKVSNNNLIILAVYVDDIIVGCKDKNEILKFKNEIRNHFEVTDKGLLEHFLGMKVKRDGETGNIEISQETYINDLLQEYNMENCKSSSVPLDSNYQIKCDEKCEKVESTLYQSLIGALLYLALTTRPDILHSVSKLAQRNADPHTEHFKAAKNVLRYLKGTKDLKLKFCKGGNQLIGYADADWGGCTTNRKSYSGYIFYLGNCAISWESKKQSTTALSSTEAEYISMSNAAKEAIYLRRLLQELGFLNKEGVKLNVDNQGALKLATNPVFHNRSKHIDIKYHHIREVVNNKEICLEYCPTEEMVADIFTKNLTKAKHNKFMEMLNLKI